MIPPLGAGPVSVTVPEEELPPVTLVGFNVSEESVADLTASDAVRVTPPYEAEMVAEVDVPTGFVLTANVALVAPAATDTVDGTIAALGLLLERLTTAPPLGAGPLSVTVPEEELPPVTLVGFSVREETVGRGGGVTVSVAALLTTLPTELVTTTVNCAPLSEVVLGGVV